MAALLPTSTFGLPRCGSQKFSLNLGPFNMKEHVLIMIFANAEAAFGNGSAYAVGIVTIMKAFYGRNISFIATWLLIITTQVLGYGWAGLLRKYVVEPSHMWWPGTLVQVSLFRNLSKQTRPRKSNRSRVTCSIAVGLLVCPVTSVNMHDIGKVVEVELLVPSLTPTTSNFMVSVESSCHALCAPYIPWQAC
ncbi:oligopeptide transporter 4-like protein [Tanacetum coccineum]